MKKLLKKISDIYLRSRRSRKRERNGKDKMEG